MAKVQVKKAAARSARRATKANARVKTAARTARKQVVAKTARPVKAVKKAAKTAAKVVAKAKPKSVAKAAAKVATKARPAKAVKAAVAALPKKLTAVPPPPARGPIAAKVPSPAADAKKTRTRRPRPRVHSDGAPVANWLPQGEKPRPSSFIPAPARAEAPSLIAAPPASSDRLIRPEDVTEFVTRTVPIRVDVEQGGGKVYIGVNPEDVVLRAGEGIEWDFRYIGGADVTVDELIVDFEKSSPFAQGTFKTRKPGAARPHRQLSGPIGKNAPAARIAYTIRAMNPFKTEMGLARVFITVAK
jgi:hypothetical protein